MHIDVNIRFHPEKIRELRDLYGIGAEADVYKDFFVSATRGVFWTLILRVLRFTLDM